MIDIVVKTLDSHNHQYSVPDNLTIQRFKEHIASSINIPADRQRLIYCGKVLQDDKTLAELDLNGQTVHCVQRAPPGARPGNQSGSARTTHHHHHHHHRHRHPAGENSMYIGAFTLPHETIDVQGEVFPAIGPSSAGVRLNTAHQMVQRASSVLDRLEQHTASPTESSENVQSVPGHQSTPATTTTTNSTATPPTSSPTSQSGARVTLPINMPPNIGPIYVPSGGGFPLHAGMSQAVQAASAAAMAAAMNAVRSSGMPNITIVGHPPHGMMNIQMRGPRVSLASSTERRVASAPPSERASPTSEQPPSTHSQASTTSDTSSRTTTTTSARGSVPSTTSNSAGHLPPNIEQRIEHPPTSALVEMLDQLERLNERLRPHLQTFRRNLTDDPRFQTNEERTLAHRNFSRVSEVLHILSHAYHAVSDMLVDYHQDPPRRLRAQPFLLQAEISVASTVQTSMNAPTATTPSSGTSPSENMTTPSSVTSTSTPTSTTVTNAESSSLPLNGNSMFMELGPTSIAIDSVTHVVPDDVSSEDRQGDGQNNALIGAHVIQGLVDAIRGDTPQTSTAPSTTVTHTVSGSTATFTTTTSSGDRSPPDLMRSVAQALSFVPGLLGQLSGRGGTPNTTQTTSSTPAQTTTATTTASAARPQPTPTTATATRSTPGANVQMGRIPGMNVGNFDPFLQCNSHHLLRPVIHVNRHPSPRTRQAASATPADSTQPPASGLADMFGVIQNLIGQRAPSQPHSGPPLLNLSPALLNLLSQLQNQQNTGSQNTSSQNQQNTGNQGGGAMTDQMFTRLVESMFGLLTGNEQNTTLANFLSTLPEYTYVEGESILIDLFHILSQNMTFGNLIGLFLGHGDEVNRLIPYVQTFIRERVLNGQPATTRNISDAADRILTEIDSQFEAAANDGNVREGINYAATLHNFFQERLCDVITVIMTDNSPSAGTSLISLYHTILSEFVTLSRMCFTDSTESLNRVLERRVVDLLLGMNPLIQQWTFNTTISQLHAIANSTPVQEDQVQRFIVYTNDQQRMVGEGDSQTLQRSEVQTNEDMEVDRAPTPVYDFTDEVSDEEEVSVSDREAQQLLGAVSVDRSPEVDVVLGSESWHNMIPTDWVPVISRDIQRQRRQAPQAPLSDAYLSGMPSKRRKTAKGSCPQGSISQVISASLRDAVSEAGVEPLTSTNEMCQAASQNSSLEKAYKDQVHAVLSKRIQSDEDYNSDKFPNTKRFFKKK